MIGYPRKLKLGDISKDKPRASLILLAVLLSLEGRARCTGGGAQTPDVMATLLAWTKRGCAPFPTPPGSKNCLGEVRLAPEGAGRAWVPGLPYPSLQAGGTETEEHAFLLFLLAVP